MFDSLITLLNSKYERWSFIGSIVDYHHFNGQVMIGDIDVVTSDYGELDFAESMRAPREKFRWKGRLVEVFRGVPSAGMFETPEERIAKLEQVASISPQRADKCRRVIERYRGGRGAIVGVSGKRNHIADPRKMVACPHLGAQIDTIRCDQCGQGKGQDKPVYSCAIHGRCTHRLEQRGQRSAEAPTEVCVGCNDGPWPMT
jgi:hypothetical protein